MSRAQWMIYGAYGHSGAFITEEALRRGHRPILAGRSKEKLWPFAERYGLDWVAFDLSDREKIHDALRKVDLLLNAAGPFVKTSQQLVQACLASNVHYTDIANEIPVFQMLQSYDDTARKQGIVLMSGVGFGVTATNCLVKYVAERMPDAIELSFAGAPFTSYRSAGVAKTVLELLPFGGKLRRGGELVDSRLGSGAIQLRFPDGERTLVSVPTGDLEAAYLATGIPNVTTYSAEFPTSFVFRILLPIVQKLLGNKRIRQWAEYRINRRKQVSKPRPEMKGNHRPSYVWVKANNESGREFQAWLTLDEGYRFTAVSSVLSVEKMITSKLSGALVPAQAFGADFVLEIEGTKRYLSLPHEPLR